MAEMQTVSHPYQTGEDFHRTTITYSNFCTGKPGDSHIQRKWARQAAFSK